MAPRPDQGDELLETKFFIPNSESDKSGKDDADEEGVEIVDAIGSMVDNNLTTLYFDLHIFSLGKVSAPEKQPHSGGDMASSFIPSS